MGGVSVLRQQFGETKGIVIFQRPHLYPQPFLALGVFQDLALELLEGLWARSEPLKVNGGEHLERFFQPGFA